MRKKYLKILSILTLCLCFVLVSNVYASSVALSGNSSGSPNSKVTITVGGDFTGRVNLSVSNGTLSTTSVWVENNSQSVTVTLGASGTTTVTATAAAGASDASGNIITVGSSSKSITINKPTTNNTTTTTQKPATNNTTTNKNTNTNKTTTTAKSSNAYLKNLLLNVEGLTPAFSKNITTYSLNVGEDIDAIKVNASVEHSKAVYSVSGNTNLKAGENTVTIRVTAENGAVRTYKINVLKSDDPVKSDATLSSLIIEDVNLGQTFDPNVTEYNAGDITVKGKKLNIYAYPNNENAKVEIMGNENLEAGEQKVTIKVTSENGKVTKDYVVSFNKLYSDDDVQIYSDALKNVEDKESIGDKLKAFYDNTLKENMTVIILYLFVWVEFIQVVYLYEKLKKYEDTDKITVGKRIKTPKVKETKIKEKKEKPRRVRENPIFPDEEEKNN